MKYCSKCGNELMDEAVLCTKCGCLIEMQQQVNQQTNSGVKEKSADNKEFGWASLVVAIIGFVATIIWVAEIDKYYSILGSFCLYSGINSCSVIAIVLSSIRLKTKNIAIQISSLVLGCLCLLIILISILCL